ncbi:amidohydrolase family protein [Phyllobacterium chamaecytisi]|uniref:amidohydrolase family protein n=1 Tax=Phyllobacterium chamaecytisi TaxID=2876082 RepID=UPI001CCC5136|nr:amidohydrolase family protein [Phyllobacterium sp. KW56]MBZ9603138.1 amidohydrolase family protein [Phyllobacterium sp. KW56]
MSQGTSTLALPEGSCDCHVHVFGPRATFPLDKLAPYAPGLASFEDLAARQTRIGHDRVIVVQPSVYGSDNRCTIDALRRFQGAARGVIVVTPQVTQTELDAFNDAGCRGVRLNLAAAGGISLADARDQLKRTADQVAGLGWALQIFANLTVIAALAATIDELPVNVILDHFGLANAAKGIEQPLFSELLDLVAKGTYVKVAAPYLVSNETNFTDVRVLVHAFLQANPNRVIWGSNWPHAVGGTGQQDSGDVAPFRDIDDGASLQQFADWIDDRKLLRLVLVDNPERLFWK